MSWLQPFLTAAPPPFDRVELLLPAPQRGHTWELNWTVPAGTLVTTGQRVCVYHSAADAADLHPVELSVPDEFSLNVAIENSLIGV